MTISKDTLVTYGLAIIVLVVGSVSVAISIFARVSVLLLPNSADFVVLNKTWASLHWGLALMGIGVSLIKIHDCLQRLSEIAEQKKTP
jgi:hypothetical protein